MTHIHDQNQSLKGVRRFWKRNHEASSLRGHQLLSSYEASLNFLALSGMRITVHYIVEKWPEGHYHYCFPSHVVKCSKNDVFYIHLYYNFVHVYAHFIFTLNVIYLRWTIQTGSFQFNQLRLLPYFILAMQQISVLWPIKQCWIKFLSRVFVDD